MKSSQHKLRGRITVHPERSIGRVSPHILGHFVEHFPGCVYGGYYDPESPLADNQGFRTDVLDAVRRVQPAIMRWPGGNFVSAYHWHNGIGEENERPAIYDPVWGVQESNRFGTAEFISLCRKANAEPYICLNLGTGTIDEAMQWVEYCNHDSDTKWAALRKQHGHSTPFDVKFWGLGNEVFGPWQMNAMPAPTYGRVALEYAKAVKWIDPDAKLVIVGGQDPDWHIDVLREVRDPILVENGTLPAVDYVSIHMYFTSEPVGFYETMAAADYMEEQTQVLRDAIRAVYGFRDQQPKIAWDEWNFYRWAHYERISENDRNERYDLKSALFTACALNGFIRQCDIVGMANYSPFVNIRGAVFVDGENLVLRPQYHVFDLFGNHAGKTAIETTVACDTFSADLMSITDQYVYANPKPGKFLDVAASLMEDDRQLFISIVNRNEDHDIECTLAFAEEPEFNHATVFSINADSPSASNTPREPDKVALEERSIHVIHPFSYTVPAHSITGFLFEMK